ncbi:MAG TPA: haloacid dehalogenase type II [Roseomonas sp.]|jgi:2-haloacid dehalogenase
MSMDGVKALVFDVFGSVVDWRTSIAQQAKVFFAKHGIETDGYDFAVAWRKQYQPAMEEVRSGRRPFERLDVLHRENLLKVLPQFGIDPGKLSEEEIDEFNRSWHRLDPWPDSVRALTRLKTKYFIAPLSNGNIVLMANVAKRAGIPWDAILGSEVVRAFKPTPEAYLRTCDVLGMKPHEVALMAAHNNDLGAARRCGLRTGFVTRPTEHGPGQTTDLKAEQDWDVIGTDFNDVATKLGCA